MQQYWRKYRNVAYVLLGSLAVYSCASIASPSGGDYDFDPPKVIKSFPEPNALNVTTKKVTIEFDELIQIEKPSEKVIITPPQRAMPIIRAINNKITVELKDSLIPNVTYTIDFTDAVADNNEKNVLENFAFSFSTGDVLDSLSVSGKVLSADNLEPVKGIYVGIHTDLNDSAFTKRKFDRISKTNESGEFTIKGMAAGKYKIYALDDMNRDYIYDNPAEALAFSDSIIIPSHVRASRQDTLFKDGIVVDTVRTVEYTRFIPDNIILRSFLSDFKRQYLQKSERLVNEKISIFFGAPTELPTLKPLNFEKEDWGLLEKTVKNDTLHYWITDPAIATMDTLTFQVSYLKTDTLNMPVLTVDTLNFVNRQRKSQERELEKRIKERENPKKKNKEDLYDYLEIKTNLSSAWDSYRNILIEFSEPISDFDKTKFRLEQRVDSTYHNVEFNIEVDSLNPRVYHVLNKWKFGDSFRLSVDSLAFQSYYEKSNKKLESDFKVKSVDEYGHLYISLAGLDSISAFVELLDASDKPVRQVKVVDGGVLFMNLNPAKYYARIILDRNDNGVWDTGDYNKGLHPEEVYYYPKFFDIKANWEIEEDWNIKALPFDQQKPLEITKNKPLEKDSKRRQLEREEQQESKRKKQEKEEQQEMMRNRERR